MRSATSLSRSMTRTQSSWCRSWSSGNLTLKCAAPHSGPSHALQYCMGILHPPFASKSCRDDGGCDMVDLQRLMYWVCPKLRPLSALPVNLGAVSRCSALLRWVKIGVMQAEREEKLRMVEFYNARLSEREKRRDFLRARGLLNMKRMQVCLDAPIKQPPPEMHLYALHADDPSHAVCKHCPNTHLHGSVDGSMHGKVNGRHSCIGWLCPLIWRCGC